MTRSRPLAARRCSWASLARRLWRHQRPVDGGRRRVRRPLRRRSGDGESRRHRAPPHPRLVRCSSDGVLDAFTEETGIEVEVIQGGDAGTVVNQAILTNGNPQADVLFGIDSTFLTRALDEELFVAHEADGLDEVDDGAPARPRALRHADRLRRRVPQLRQGVLRGARPRRADEPRRPHRPRLRGPAGRREPGHLVAGPGLPAGHHRGVRRGRVGGVVGRRCATTACEVVDGWEEAYYSSFSGGLGSEGDRPLVVSYASSPPAEVVFADPPVDEPPTGVIDASCYRQVEGAGILAGTEHEARGRPARSTSCSPSRCRPTCRCRCSCSRRATASSCPRCSSSTPPRPTTCSSSRPRRSTPTGRTGSTGGPTSCCGDPSAMVGRAPGGPAGVPRRASSSWPVANIVGEGLRGDQGWDLRGVGEVLGDPELRQVAWFTLWQALARPCSRWSSASRPPTSSRPTSSAGAVCSKRCSSCRSCCRPSWWARPSSRCSGHAACSASTCAAARWPSCWPTPSSTTPSWSAPSGACGRASTRAPRRPPGCWARRGGRPSARHVAGHPAGGRLGRRHRVPLHLHQLRRRPHPRRPRSVDPRDRDLPADRRPPRPAGGVGARPAAAGRGGRRCSRCTAGSSGGRRRRPVAMRAPRPSARAGPGRPSLGRRQPRADGACWLGVPLLVLVERRSGWATATAWRDGAPSVA